MPNRAGSSAASGGASRHSYQLTAVSLPICGHSTPNQRTIYSQSAGNEIFQGIETSSVCSSDSSHAGCKRPFLIRQWS